MVILGRVLAALAATTLSGCATQASNVPPAPVAAASPAVPVGMQYLYGSGEAAALGEQAYRALTSHVLAVLGNMRDAQRRLPYQGGDGADRWYQVVLALGATPDMPTPLRCGRLPPAVMLDMDETTILNLGYEYADARAGTGYDAARWDAWERTGGARIAPAPGVRTAFDRLRLEGVSIVINSNRSAANAAATAQALADAGLGTFVHGDTLFLKGDVDGKSAKDGRRAAIAARYCVLALAGDQLGDFADFFNAPANAARRRALVSLPAVSALWGNGWFMLPNPVYGTGLGTGWDDTFPTDKRWTPPVTAKKDAQ